jgi:hypothetical protein
MESCMNGTNQRKLLIIADDYGMGPATSTGILELGTKGLLSGSVLLVNTPYAEQAVMEWRTAGRPMELGWHPNLTLDAPLSRPADVPSLVDAQGRFRPLGKLLRRAWLGRLRQEEIAREFLAQWTRFVDLVGQPPALVNSHQHVSLFEPVGGALLEVLSRQNQRPYVRRVREPWKVILRTPGARCKRSFLNWHGRSMAKKQERQGLPGNDWLLGVTDPPHVERDDFFESWLQRVPGRVVELCCHPGHLDETLVGRDCTPQDGMLRRRVREWELLQRPQLREVMRQSGLHLATTKDFIDGRYRQAA